MKGNMCKHMFHSSFRMQSSYKAQTCSMTRELSSSPEPRQTEDKPMIETRMFIQEMLTLMRQRHTIRLFKGRACEADYRLHAWCGHGQ
eukprot:3746500-Rhodomonas_salina.2